MKTRYNLIIFTIAEEERKDIRKRKEKTLQVLMDQKDQFPIFDVDEGKSLRDTAYEKASEILGTQNLYIEQLYTWSDPKYYEEEPQIIITYLVTVNQNLVKKLKDEYQFFRIQLIEQERDLKRKIQEVKLSNEKKQTSYRIFTKNEEWHGNVIYQNEIEDSEQVNLLTATILHTAIKRMRHRIENTKLAFHFLEEEFTLSELQQVYELLLDRKLEKANFRKKIEPMVKKTDRVISEAAYGPAQAYRYNDQYVIYSV